MEERRNEILKELDRKGRVKVTDLSKEFGCSEVTIRNDIKAMDIEGLLKRTHGGAVKIETRDGSKREVFGGDPYIEMLVQKKQIAEAAYEFLNDRDTIIIDDASTSFYLAQEIKNHPEKRIAVVTNSLIAGNELAGVGHVELVHDWWICDRTSCSDDGRCWQSRICQNSMWIKHLSEFTVLISM